MSGYGRIPVPMEQRFWARVKKTDTCWLWQGALWQGYGSIAYDRTNRKMKAHRYAYTLLVGPIPDGLTIDHLCRNRACVNPAHLEAVPIAVNVMRGNGICVRHAKKTHCINGHEFTPENTYYRPSRSSGRECRTCSRLRRAAWEKR